MTHRHVIRSVLLGVLVAIGSFAITYSILDRTASNEKAGQEPVSQTAPKREPAEAAERERLLLPTAPNPLECGTALVNLWRSERDSERGARALRKAIETWSSLCRDSGVPGRQTPAQAATVFALSERAAALRDELAQADHPQAPEAQRLVLETAERAGNAATADREMARYAKMLEARDGEKVGQRLVSECEYFYDHGGSQTFTTRRKWMERRLDPVRAEEETPAAREARIWSLKIDQWKPGNMEKLSSALRSAPKSSAARRTYSTVLDVLLLKKDYDRALSLLTTMAEHLPERREEVDVRRARIFERQGKLNEAVQVLKPYTRRPHGRRMRDRTRKWIEQLEASRRSYGGEASTEGSKR